MAEAQEVEPSSLLPMLGRGWTGHSTPVCMASKMTSVQIPGRPHGKVTTDPSVTRVSFLELLPLKEVLKKFMPLRATQGFEKLESSMET